MIQRILIAGHSQSFSLGLRGLGSDTEAVETDPIDDVFSGLNGPFPRTAGYWDALVANCRDQVVALTWQGSQHYSHFMFVDERPFDFHCSQLPEAPLVPDAQLVPERMVRTLLARSLGSLSALLARLSDAKKVIVLGTPPPKGDNAALRKILLKNSEEQTGKEIVNLDSGLLLKASEDGISLSDVRLTASTVMLKLWSELQDLMQETAHNHDADFLPFPHSLIGPDGFLRREYWAQDLTHTSREAGSVFLDEIRNYYGDQSPRQPDDDTHSKTHVQSSPFAPQGSARGAGETRPQTSQNVGMCSLALHQQSEIDQLKVEINTLNKRLGRAHEEAAQLKEVVRQLETKGEDHAAGNQARPD